MDNQQILILCGGLSTRIKKLTKKLPKSLLKFNNIPFLFFQLEWINKNGIKNVVLLTGYLETEIKKILKDKYKNLKITFVRDGKNLRGTAGAVLNAKKFLYKDFILINGDTFPLINLKKLYSFYIKNKKISTVVVRKNDKKYLQSNIKIFKKNIVYYEKNLKNNSNYIDYGIQIFNRKDFLNAIQNTNYQMMDNIYIQLIQKKKLYCFKTTKKFFEIGSYKGIKDFKNYLKK